MEFIDLDDVLEHAGEFGLYQWLLFAALAPFCLNMVFIYFTQIFITLVPTHWCKVPELIKMGLTPEMRRNISAPLIDVPDGQIHDSCHYYDVNYSLYEVYRDFISDSNSYAKSFLYSNTSSLPIKKCEEWEYDLSNVGGYHSIVSEYDWVCDRGWYAPLAQSLFFVGAIFGGILVGWIADKYGRVPALILCNIVGGGSTLLTSTSTSIWAFFIFRFIAGIAYDNIFIMMYVLVLEYIGPKHRTLVANLSIALFFTLGTTVLPWIAFWVKDWRLLNSLSAITMVLACIGYWILPESARWLMSCGRIDESVAIVENIAKINGKKIPKDILEKFKKSCNTEFESSKADESATLLDLIRGPNLRKTTLCVTFYWMVVTMVFDGHARNVSNLPLDVFIGFTVASLTELPADLFIIFTLDKWGRRWLAFGTMVASGLFSLISAMIPIGNIVVIAVFAFLGRLFVNMSMNIGLQYAAELLPTVVRAQGVSTIHTGGYIAAIISPQIVYLGQTIPQIPLIVLGAAAIIGGIVALFLPETLNTDLPQTIQDGETFGKKQKFCSFPCIPSKQEETPIVLTDFGKKASFVRQRARVSIRAATYRSSLIEHRKQTIYVQRE